MHDSQDKQPETVNANIEMLQQQLEQLCVHIKPTANRQPGPDSNEHRATLVIRGR